MNASPEASEVVAMAWQDETCETCRFQYSEECCRFPPSFVDNHEVPRYMPVTFVAFGEKHFVTACAEYAPREVEAARESREESGEGKPPEGQRAPVGRGRSVTPRYAAFGGDICYPAGGLDDLIGTGDDLDDVKRIAMASTAGDHASVSPPDWVHIADLTTMTRVCHLDGGAWVESHKPPSNAWEYGRD